MSKPINTQFMNLHIWLLFQFLKWNFSYILINFAPKVHLHNKNKNNELHYIFYLFWMGTDWGCFNEDILRQIGSTLPVLNGNIISPLYVLNGAISRPGHHVYWFWMGTYCVLLDQKSNVYDYQFIMCLFIWLLS